MTNLNDSDYYLFGKIFYNNDFIECNDTCILNKLFTTYTEESKKLLLKIVCLKTFSSRIYSHIYDNNIYKKENNKIRLKNIEFLLQNTEVRTRYGNDTLMHCVFPNVFYYLKRDELHACYSVVLLLYSYNIS